MPGRLVALACVLACCLAGSAAADVLVLRRDWTATTCSAGGCRAYPDSFSIDALYAASEASPEPQTLCRAGGRGGLKSADLDAAGVSRAELSCAWQNYDPSVKNLQEAWKDSWDVYGKCTPAGSAVDYLQLGLQLDRRYPLPQGLPALVDLEQVQAAVQAAFGVRPIVACDGQQHLRNIQLCFDPATAMPRDCPWPAPAGCAGQLSLPRSGRGIGAQCASYYLPSPVTLGGAAPPPAAAPPPPAMQPASPPTASVGVPPPAVPIQPPSAAAPEPQQEPGQPELALAPPVLPPATGGAGSMGGDFAGAAADGSEQAAPASQPAEAGTAGAASGASASSSGAGMAAALGGGIAGGIIVGVLVFGGGYVLYRRGLRAGHASAALLAGSDCSSEGERGSGPAGKDGHPLSAAEAGCAGSKQDDLLTGPAGSGHASEPASQAWAVPHFSGRMPLPTVPE